jgi:hypothetical protein
VGANVVNLVKPSSFRSRLESFNPNPKAYRPYLQEAVQPLGPPWPELLFRYYFEARCNPSWGDETFAHVEL